MSLLSEFKEFAMKGNVVDMAVGIVIGAAFGKIVSAFVDAIIMPALGWVIGGVDFSSLAVTLGESAKTGEPVTIGYGARQLASGLFSLSGAEWLSVDGSPSGAAVFVSLVIIMCASTWSALSGVSRGIKWLSNLNMALTFAFLAFFVTVVVLGALWFFDDAAEMVGSGPVATILRYVSFQARLSSFWRGLLDTRDIVFFVSVTALSLVVSFRALERRKWA